MTKKYIKEGDIVLLKDGRRCIVMPDTDNSNNELALYGILKIYNPFFPDFNNLFGIITHFDYYNDDLMPSDGDSGYTIMAVRDNPITTASCLFKILTSNSIVDIDDIIWDWKREEIKEVTMSEVEEKFGCKVKIVKENEDG